MIKVLLIIILIIVLIYLNDDKMEHATFTDIDTEAIKNISSFYKTGTGILPNISVSGNISADGVITTKKGINADNTNLTIKDITSNGNISASGSINTKGNVESHTDGNKNSFILGAKGADKRPMLTTAHQWSFDHDMSDGGSLIINECYGANGTNNNWTCKNRMSIKPQNGDLVLSNDGNKIILGKDQITIKSDKIVLDGNVKVTGLLGVNTGLRNNVGNDFMRVFQNSGNGNAKTEFWFFNSSQDLFGYHKSDADLSAFPF